MLYILPLLIVLVNLFKQTNCRLNSHILFYLIFWICLLCQIRILGFWTGRWVEIFRKLICFLSQQTHELLNSQFKPWKIHIRWIYYRTNLKPVHIWGDIINKSWSLSIDFGYWLWLLFLGDVGLLAVPIVNYVSRFGGIRE